MSCECKNDCLFLWLVLILPCLTLLLIQLPWCPQIFDIGLGARLDLLKLPWCPCKLRAIWYFFLDTFPLHAPTNHLSFNPTDLFILPVTSLSSIIISIFIGMDVVLALISFFNFSHSVRNLNHARGLFFTSILYFSLNSMAKCSARTRSRSLPPTSRSDAVARTYVRDT